jgi:hypothetical protein
LAIALAVFASVVSVPESFLTNLISVDSLSVAVVGFVFPLVIRTLNVDETMKQLEQSNELLKPPEEVRKDTRLRGSA